MLAIWMPGRSQPTAATPATVAGGITLAGTRPAVAANGAAAADATVHAAAATEPTADGVVAPEAAGAER